MMGARGCGSSTVGDVLSGERIGRDHDRIRAHREQPLVHGIERTELRSVLDIEENASGSVR